VVVSVLFAATFAIGYFYGGHAVRTELKDAVLLWNTYKVFRTPGGMLQVAELVKQETLAWDIQWNCPANLCKGLPAANSQIFGQAHYTYRIPLSAHWVLEKVSQTPLRYRLKVPKPEPQLPVTVNLSTIQVRHGGGMFAPAGLNQQTMQSYMQPSLNERAKSDPYFEAVRADAEKTVKEFAQKWMRDGKSELDEPAEIEVVFY